MKAKFEPIPELDRAIEIYAAALMKGDRAAAEALVGKRAIESHREVFRSSAPQFPFESYKTLARAKIGFQYISKVRFSGLRGELLLQSRWSNAEGSWTIIQIDDLTHRRSGWSDEAPLGSKDAARGANNA
jgi:hypothetical protein